MRRGQEEVCPAGATCSQALVPNRVEVGADQEPNHAVRFQKTNLISFKAWASLWEDAASLHLLWPPPPPPPSPPHTQPRLPRQGEATGPPGGPLPALDLPTTPLPREAQPGKAGSPSQAGGANTLVLGQLKAPAYEIFMQPDGRRPAEDSPLGLWGCSNGSSSCSPALSPTPSFVLQTQRACSANIPTTHTHRPQDTLQGHR